MIPVSAKLCFYKSNFWYRLISRSQYGHVAIVFADVSIAEASRNKLTHGWHQYNDAKPDLEIPITVTMENLLAANRIYADILDVKDLPMRNCVGFVEIAMGLKPTNSMRKLVKSFGAKNKWYYDIWNLIAVPATACYILFAHYYVSLRT